MRSEMKSRGRRDQRGNAVMEVALLAPWIFFLFAGVFDFGFYSYALIATQNAARGAVLYTSSQPDSAEDDETACILALGELSALPNTRSLAPPCPTAASSISDSFPVAVDAERITGPDGEPSSRVSVTYRTIPLIPIPGLTGRMTFTRTVEMRIREN